MMTDESLERIREALSRNCGCRGFEMCGRCETSIVVAADLLNEIDRLRSIILKELTENDDLGAEYTYVLLLKEEIARLRDDDDT